MTRPNIQIDDLVREMTEEEHQSYLADQEQDRVIEEENQARQKAILDSRNSALAKLAALGLTEDEIAAI